MKRFMLFFTMTFFFLTLILSSNLKAQELEAEKVHALSKDAKKGYLGSFSYDENAKEYTLIFVREKKKSTVYVTYKYDYDFNQISENEEELSDLEASKKFDFIDFTEEEWNNPPVVRIDMDGFNAAQVVLRRGYIQRTWVRAGSYTMGNYVVYMPGHYEYKFIEEEKVKPKVEVELQLDPRTPAGIAKLANKMAQKVQGIAYFTDEPGAEVQTGAVHYHPRMGTFYMKRKRSYAEASGDIMILGRQGWNINKDMYNRFIILKYGAKDLAQKAETILQFDYIYECISHKFMPDGTLLAVFAPGGVYKNPGPNPNSREFYYVKISPDAEIVEKIKFESPSSKWNINDITMLASGEVYLYGEASNEKNEKYFD